MGARSVGSSKRRIGLWLAIGGIALAMGGSALAEEPEAAGAPASESEAVDPELAVQEPGAPEPKKSLDIEEILITSQGHAETVQDASISVAAFNAEYIEALGAKNISDLSQFTPNLEIRTVFSASNPTLFIRGVGIRDFNANSSSAVAVYNDDVYMNSPAGQLGQLFDLQQVEVLRGPQGALYGRNASAGAIRLISRKPAGDEVNASASVTYGSFDQLDVEGAFEAPLFQDLLSMRISGVMHRRDGITDNRCGSDDAWRNAPLPPAGRTDFGWRVFRECFNNTTTAASGPPKFGQDWDKGTGGHRIFGNPANAVVPDDVTAKVNNVDDWAGRGLLRLQPANGSDWTFNVHGGRNRAQARSFQMLAAEVFTDTGEFRLGGTDTDTYADPDTVFFDGTTRIAPDEPEDGDVYAGDYNLTGPELLDRLGANLTGEIPAGNWSIRSITAYEWNERFVQSNVDSNPYIGLQVEFGNTSWQASQDLKAFWDGGGAWTWLFGLNFLFEDLDVLNDFRLAPAVINRQDYAQQTFYGAPYGYFTWEVSEALSLEGGLRWNVEHKDYEITAALLGSGAASATRTTEASSNAPSGDISINYHAFADANFYAKYSRGWKGPQINGNILCTACEDVAAGLVSPVAPETVHALEMGLKSSWLDNRLRVNTAAFYYDYEDIQIFQVRNSTGGAPVQTLVNANDADIYGVELEIQSRPLDGWAPEFLEGLLVFTSFAYLESRYTDFLQVRDEVVGSDVVERIDNFSGNQLINAPRFAFSGYAQWDFLLGRYGALVPRFDWSFKDQVFFSPANIDPVSQDAFWLLNARLAYRTPNDMIELAGWVRNVTDEIYRLDVIDLSRFQKSIIYAFGVPRTYGVTLSVSF